MNRVYGLSINIQNQKHKIQNNVFENIFEDTYHKGNWSFTPTH